MKKEKPKASEAFEKQNLAILIILLVFFMITIAFYIILNVNSKDVITSNNETTAAKIIDGDTFQISSGDTVRLICIDAPEKNQQGFEEAKQFLSDLILDKQVRLETDVSDKDAYGRLLRYAYVNSSQTGNEIFVNKEMVKNNYAALFPYGNDTKRCNEINSS